MIVHQMSAIKSSEYKSDYDREKRQKYHRIVNTVLSLFVLYMGWKTIPDLYDSVSGLEQQQIIDSEIAQLVEDEGYKPHPYKDSRGLWTVGFGHLILEGEDFSDGIDGHQANAMLRKDYTYAENAVTEDYPWATGEVKLVLTNMTYQMGRTGVSEFKKTLDYLEKGEYDSAAGEMLNSAWARQTPLRASRLAGRIMALK